MRRNPRAHRRRRQSTRPATPALTAPPPSTAASRSGNHVLPKRIIRNLREIEIIREYIRPQAGLGLGFSDLFCLLPSHLTGVRHQRCELRVAIKQLEVGIRFYLEGILGRESVIHRLAQKRDRLLALAS